MTGKAACNNHDAKNMMSPKETGLTHATFMDFLNFVPFFITGFKKKKEKPRGRKKKEKDITRFVFRKTGINTRICQES